jgi:hypothetical protein
VTVVCIVGNYRTGKSYLLNRLMQIQGQGFPLGSTVQAKTKGIWIWIGDFFGNPDRALILVKKFEYQPFFCQIDFKGFL